MKKCSGKGFTLVELLVVITIIAVLAGFSVPAISGALTRANQAEDLNNAKQLAGVLFIEANENNGRFRRGKELNPEDDEVAEKSTEIFQGLLEDEALTSADVISGYGTDSFDGEPDELEDKNVSWAYFWGLTTEDDDELPLLMTKGSEDVITTEALTGTPQEVELSGTGSPWGKKGVIVAYKGQNAEFLKADKDGKIKLGANATPIDGEAALLQP